MYAFHEQMSLKEKLTNDEISIVYKWLEGEFYFTNFEDHATPFHMTQIIEDLREFSKATVDALGGEFSPTFDELAFEFAQGDFDPSLPLGWVEDFKDELHDKRTARKTNSEENKAA